MLGLWSLTFGFGTYFHHHNKNQRPKAKDLIQDNYFFATFPFSIKFTGSHSAIRFSK